MPDLNGSYDEGYEQGHTEGYNEGYSEGEGVGYNQGKTDGINEQKGKLSQITISENGTYAKEDGYNKVVVNVPDLNGDYNEGYEQGQADVAANARVLNVTENGVYKSKFSDPIVPEIVTGVYADGTEFYSYAELNRKVFNTKIAATIDSRLEFWYKGDNTSLGFGDNVIIGAGNNDDNNCFQVRYYEGFNGWVKISVGNSTIDINNWNDKVWHHLIVSKAEGLWVDGEKKGDFTASNTINGKFYINGIGYDTARNANGTFGMIKIDDVVIIPTANGFQNVNTGELLQVVKDGAYTFTENLPIYGEGELYKTINVNVPDLNGSYDEGYAEGERVGYAQGKTDGVNEQKGKLESINITENGTYRKEDGYSEVVVNVPDLNGDYSEGYAQGKIDGIDEQKSKLESISITENGVFSKEDGYNHIEVNVPDLNGSYDQGQADLVAKARVLNVTENGVYKSKYSDPIVPDTYTVTGVYDNGTNFYSYAELNGKVFNTKIAGSVDSRLEFWYKGDNTSAGSGLNVIMGSGDYANNAFEIKYHITENNILLMDIGTSPISVSNWDDTVWHHLIISKAEGIWIDGEKKRDFSPTTTIKGELLINGVSYDTDGTRNANGCFGMIKIDNTIIIPTADGFLNTNTGELLEVVKDGGYNFTENLPTYPEGEGELYKTINVNIDVDSYYNNGYNQGKIDGVNEQKSKLESISITENGTYTKEDGYNEVVVNVPDLNGSYDEGYTQGQADAVANAKALEVTKNGQYGDGKTLYKTINVNVNAVPKINVKEAGLKFAYSTFTEVPEWADFNGITDMAHMFDNCTRLETIPLIDTSNATNMSYMFYTCVDLQTISLIDTSNVTNMESMFSFCYNLQTIPPLNTSNVTNMESMFSYCDNLQTIPALNAQSLRTNRYSNIIGNGEKPELTDFGGFLNLKSSLEGDGNLKSLPNLTYESCINVLNGLYDFTGNGETPNDNQGKLKVAQSFIDKVGDEISIGINKGWVISV